MKNKLRKNYQKKFNKKLKEVNKNILEDNIWLGRFVFLQKDAKFWRFPDNSGGELIIFIRGYDKKTGFYKDYRFTYAPWLRSSGYKIWEIANDFIVKGVQASIREEVKDYTKEKVNVDELMCGDWNFYTDYQGV